VIEIMMDFEGPELKEKVVNIDPVAKTTKGGRTRSFRALVVVGDGNGRVGTGVGKAAEVAEAIRKGVEEAKKNMFDVPIVETTIPHEVMRNRSDITYHIHFESRSLECSNGCLSPRTGAFYQDLYLTHSVIHGGPGCNFSCHLRGKRSPFP
jgi:hypothetical protein